MFDLFFAYRKCRDNLNRNDLISRADISLQSLFTVLIFFLQISEPFCVNWKCTRSSAGRSPSRDPRKSIIHLDESMEAQGSHDYHCLSPVHNNQDSQAHEAVTSEIEAQSCVDSCHLVVADSNQQDEMNNLEMEGKLNREDVVDELEQKWGKTQWLQLARQIDRCFCLINICIFILALILFYPR